jgi:hypothetical protein
MFRHRAGGTRSDRMLSPQSGVKAARLASTESRLRPTDRQACKSVLRITTSPRMLRCFQQRLHLRPWIWREIREWCPVRLRHTIEDRGFDRAPHARGHGSASEPTRSLRWRDSTTSFSDAINNDQAKEGSMAVDDFMAAQMIRDLARKENEPPVKHASLPTSSWRSRSCCAATVSPAGSELPPSSKSAKTPLRSGRVTPASNREGECRDVIEDVRR